jgi:hypothetical protein
MHASISNSKIAGITFRDKQPAGKIDAEYAVAWTGCHFYLQEFNFKERTLFSAVCNRVLFLTEEAF